MTNPVVASCFLGVGVQVDNAEIPLQLPAGAAKDSPPAGSLFVSFDLQLR